MRAFMAAAGRASLLAFLAGWLTSGAAFAQGSPATSKVDAGYAAKQQQQMQVQPLNNQPVWSEVRSGTPQTTQVRGRETDVLIQPEGQTWRTLRNSMVSVYAGWALVIVFLAIVAFYLWKGTMPLHEPKTGRKIRRFTNWQMRSTGPPRGRSWRSPSPVSS